MEIEDIDTQVSVCMLASAGFQPKDIAERLGLPVANVLHLMQPVRKTLGLPKRQGDIY